MEGVILEPGKYGVRAVITAPWREEMKNDLTKARILELELNDGRGWRGNDLSFLTLFPHLQSLRLIDLRISSVEEIHSLHELRDLELITYCDTEIRFSSFPGLERCALEWRRKAESIFECLSLKNLFVDHYDANDITSFTKLVNLRSLALMNAPIQNLHGLSKIKLLKSLRLGRLVCLASLEGIEGLSNLEELEIQTCRRIHSINAIAALSQLQKLYINDCGDIESLTPVMNLTQLREVLFYESTNIVDGNLIPLIQLPNLSRVSFKNRRHYSHRREDFGIAYTGIRS